MSTLTTARILYSQIQALRNGLYVWVDPDEESVLKLQHLMSGAPFKTVQSTALHATVLYHQKALPHTIKIPIDRPLAATVRELIVWDEKDGEKIVVAALDSPDLQGLHAELKDQYLTHSFPDYNAHVTVGKKVDLNAASRIWLSKTNEALEANPLQLVFGPQIRGSSLA